MCSHHTAARLALIALSSLTLSAAASAQDSVRISEFLASNDGSLLDEDGDDSDWIEIHNRGLQPVNLQGWHLTDSAIQLDHWTLPAETLGPDERLLVFASDKDRAVAGQELHTNFKLSAGGEYLALVRPALQIASDFAPAFPVQTPDRSYGFLEGSDTQGYFEPPTPLEPNGNLFASLPIPTASIPGGWQSLPQLVELSTSAPGAELRYTIDGSKPQADTGLLYQGPIPIAQTTTLRVRAFQSGFGPSPSTGFHYLFPQDVLEQDAATAAARGFPEDWIDRNGLDWEDNTGARPGAWYGMDSTPLAGLQAADLWDGLQSIPTLCLTTDMDDWFGSDPAGPFGIYPNSTQEGDAWERAADMEWIGPDGANHRTGCGVAVQGGGSTKPYSRSQLSLSIRFKAEFGPSKLNFPVFEEGSLESFDYLVLDAYLQHGINQRFSSDAHLDRENCQELRDSFSSDLHRAMGHEDARTRPVHLFLNGHYWGVYGLHERPDHRFAAAHFGGDDSEYDYTKHGVLRSGNDNPANHPSDPGAWATALDIAAGGLAPGLTYQGQDAWTLFQDYVDVGSYIDYVLLNFYLGNVDWPSHNWISVGHARESDGSPAAQPKFRFYSWDAEAILHGVAHGTLVGDGVWDRSDYTSTNPKNALYFHTALIEQPEYLLRFADRLWEHIAPGGALHVDPASASAGTRFDPEHPERNRPAALYAKLSDRLAPAVPFEFARWGGYWPQNPSLTLADWYAERDRLLEELLPVRTTVLVEQLRTGLALYPTVDAPLANPRGGAVRSGTIVELEADPQTVTWTTLDGTDPRLPAGGISAGAMETRGSVRLAGANQQGLIRLRSRSLRNGEWSALERADFFVGPTPVRLNELQAANDSTLADDFGEFDDWCEIFNPADSPADLSGWRLTDDASDPAAFTFPEDTVLAPKSYLVVWLDGDPEQGPLHADFKLSQSGEALYLFAPEAFGKILVDQTQFTGQGTDHSWGRVPSHSGPWMPLPVPTPGMANHLGSVDPR